MESSNTSRTRGRRRVIDELRGAIVSGKIPPGKRLPNRSELSAQFSAGSDAVQYAINQLAAEGFVHSRRKVGTFVSEKAPHLCQYAVVFPPQRFQPKEQTTSFYHALAQVASLPDPAGRRRARCYFGVDAHVDNEDYMHLVA